MDHYRPASGARNSSAEDRNRVDAIPEVVRALREQKAVCAPGYDAASRGPGAPVTYDPAGQSVILLEGNFAGHPNVRGLLDLIVFVDVPADVQRTRFISFYRWKGFDENAIEQLWRERCADEWPGVDRQREAADLILMPGVS